MGFIRKIFSGREPPKAPDIPKAPAPQEIMDVIDEIAGAQAINVVGADGKKRRVIKRLPRTKEEEALYQQGEQMMAVALNNIKELYHYDPSSVVDFAPIIETFANLNQERADNLAQIADFGTIQQDIADFRQMQSSLMDERFLRDKNMLEEQLAHTGHADSTVGREERNLLKRNQTLAAQEADLNALQFGEGLADTRLNRNTNIFNLKEADRAGRLQAAQLQYELEQQKKADVEQLRQNALNENQNQLQIGANLVGNDLNKAMGNQANQQALQQMQVANQAQLGHYNANVNAIKAGYDMQMQQFNAKPLGFGDALKRLAFAKLGGGVDVFGNNQKGQQQPQQKGFGMSLPGFGQVFKGGMGIPGFGGGFGKGLVY
jgi:hypothetical protein